LNFSQRSILIELLHFHTLCGRQQTFIRSTHMQNNILKE
jgi:hypothetical protein